MAVEMDSLIAISTPIKTKSGIPLFLVRGQALRKDRLELVGARVGFRGDERAVLRQDGDAGDALEAAPLPDRRDPRVLRGA